MIRLSLSREALSRLHEGQLINVAWWLWECEELIAAKTPVILRTIEDLAIYGTVEHPYRPGEVIYYKKSEAPYGIPPGGLR